MSPFVDQLANVIAAMVRDDSLTTEQKKKKINAALKMLDDGTASDTPDPEDAGGPPLQTQESLRHRTLPRGAGSRNFRELMEGRQRKSKMTTAEFAAAAKAGTRMTGPVRVAPQSKLMRGRDRDAEFVLD